MCVVAGLGQHDVAKRLAHAKTVLGTGPEPGAVTVGLAQLQPNDSAHDLIERADHALYAQRAHRRVLHPR